MNFFVYNGSIRKNGSTNNLYKSVLDHLKAERYDYHTCEDSFSPCSNCGFCKTLKTCTKQDSFPLKDISKASGIIIVSPVYFFNLSPKSLDFLSRLYCLNLSGKIFGLVLSSGSQFRFGGVDLIQDQFSRIDEFCGSRTVTPYNKVTFDSVTSLNETDNLGIDILIEEMRTLHNET